VLIRYWIRAAARAAVTVGMLALVAACGGGGGSGGASGMSLAPPQNVTAEPGDREVTLSWSPVEGAVEYTVYWSDTSVPTDQGAPNRSTTISDTRWKHTDLLNLQTYSYRVLALDSAGRGSEGVEVSAEPGPVPAPVEWAVVVTDSGENSIHFSPATNADRYRVYYAESPAALGGKNPAANYIEVVSPPAIHLPANPADPVYYRIIGMSGPRYGGGGYTAVSTVFDIRDIGFPYYVTAALWDVDGDGCLDMVGASGDCLGGFQSYDLASRGLSGLFSVGRVNRDSRFADFNNDGLVDIFTNVYARADDLSSRAILHINDGNGSFYEDAGIAAMQIGGFGETVLAADFDNDGDVDIFVPHYWHRDDGGRNWLLINDGNGIFIDRAEAAGVARGPPQDPYIPEGTQAIDFNEDGWIDIYVASALYINNRDGTFSDRAAELDLPVSFDEGMKFTDADADGDFDLILNDSYKTKLFRNESGVFDAGTLIAGDAAQTTFGFGLSVCDVNGDGFEDVLVPVSDVTTRVGTPHLLINVNGQFVRSDVGVFPEGAIDLMACGDLNGDGLSDLLTRGGSMRTMITRAASAAFIKVRVVGANGQRNQQGRVVRIRSTADLSMQMLRVVEAGSGYLAQGDYDLLVAAPWEGNYEVAVRFRTGWATAIVEQGQMVTFYEDGRLEAGLN